MCMSKKCCNRNERKFSCIPLNVVNFNITITRNTVVVVVVINFKNLNFNNLTITLLVLTMFLFEGQIIWRNSEERE